MTLRRKAEKGRGGRQKTGFPTCLGCGALRMMHGGHQERGKSKGHVMWRLLPEEVPVNMPGL